MNVLVFNCGSSSLKFQVISLAGGAAAGAQDRRLARGLIERIGGDASCTFTSIEGKAVQHTAQLANHEAAARHALNWLASASLAGEHTAPLHSLDAVGHRLVHGGAHFHSSVRRDDPARTPQ
jgi:acetate kinase